MLVCLGFSFVASATEAPPPASDAAVAFYGDLDLGVRALRLDGTELRGRTTGNTLVVRGAHVPTKALFETQLRFGFRFHGFLVGVGAGLGYADWGAGRPQPLGDMVVRPDGFVVSGAVLASAGYRYQRGVYAGRLEGFLGAEIVGIGLERPGFPETRVIPANTVRSYFAPRLTFERAFHDVSIGVFVQADVRSPGNVWFGISLTPWSSL